MTETTTVTSEPTRTTDERGRLAPKKATKKTPAKKPAKAETNGKHVTADRSMFEVPAPQRKVALVKALRKMDSCSAVDARPIEDLCKKLGYTRFDVYGLVSGTSGKAGSAPRCLMATGHVKVVRHEDTGLCVHLTAKGYKTDFTESPFA